MKKDQVYRLCSCERFLHKNKLVIFVIFKRAFMRIIFSCDVSYKAEIVKGTVFPHHALGVVIHPKVIIGENCHINQNVTIDGRNGIDILPIIGNNVRIGANAVVLGNITIGNNAQICAGSVVIESVPTNVVVAGAQAKLIKFINQGSDKK